MTEAAEDGNTWNVTVTYGPAQPLDENPLNRKPEVSWDFNASEEIVDRDEDDQAVVNTAFDYFDPPLTRNRRDAVLVIRRNEAQFPYDLAADLQDATNLTDFLFEGGAGCWKIEKLASSSASILSALFAGTEVLYWPVVYELHYSARGWKRPLLNQGMRQLTSDGTEWEAITMNGQPISAPALLAEDGRQLAPDGDPIYREFRVYKERDFAALNLAGIDLGKGTDWGTFG